MRILFDQGTPVTIRNALQGHTVRTANEEGWRTLSNGELLRVAEVAVIYSPQARAGRVRRTN
jgi:ketol-acid reductoisomerase